MRFEGFIAQSYQSQSRRLGCEETINLTLEKDEQTGRMKFYRAPGLRDAYDAGAPSDGRGMLSINGHVFVVQGTQVKDFLFDGTTLTLAGTSGPIVNDGKRAYLAANTEATQLVVYSGGKVYLFFAGAMTEITWMGVPVVGVDVINDFFLFLSSQGDGFFFSEPGDASSGDPLNFRSCEGNANKYTRLIVDRNVDVWVFGDQSSMVFYNDAGDPNEPFKKNLSASMQSGIVAPDAVEAFDNRVWWIDQNGIAQASNGYNPERISTHAVENTWRSYGNISGAFSKAVSWNGHNCIDFTFPGATENISTAGGIVTSVGMTWRYDPLGGWTKVPGWDSANGRFVSNRGMSACIAQNRQLVADRDNGKIYILDPEYYFDSSTRVPWLRRAPNVNEEGYEVEYPWFELAMQTGVGDGTNADLAGGTVTPEANPVVYMRYSDDWAQNFTMERFRSLGEQGDYGVRVFWTRNGAAYNRVFEVGGSAGCAIAIDDCFLRDPKVLAA